MTEARAGRRRGGEGRSGRGRGGHDLAEFLTAYAAAAGDKYWEQQAIEGGDKEEDEDDEDTDEDNN